MKTLTEGHKYELSNFENKEAQGQVLQFIEKRPKEISELQAGDEVKVNGEIMKFVARTNEDSTITVRNKEGSNLDVDIFSSGHDGFSVVALKTINDGTTNEEVLEMLIDRMNSLNKKFPCRENSIAITKMDEALLWLNKRTTDRTKRNVEGKQLS